MTIQEVREKYLRFFEEKGHAIVPSASLYPENDPTTLFTGSGMQPMIPYLLGEKHPKGIRVADSQKCFRAQDIDEVGDNRHTTFFEMLGNWSLGDYFKKEQIPWVFDFYTKVVGLDPKRLYVSVFRGSPEIGIPKDEESVKIWNEVFSNVGIQARDVDFAERDGMSDGRIFYYDETKNWWSRSGVPKDMPEGEPGGPDSEVFFDFDPQGSRKIHESSTFSKAPCHVNCDCGRFLEIGNSVFMEYRKIGNPSTSSGNNGGGGFGKLAQRNVDFGGGLERTAAASMDEPDMFRIRVFRGALETLERLSGKMYVSEESVARSFRVVVDHLRAAAFLMGDSRGVPPSNTDQGYVVRRLIRRAVRHGKQLGIREKNWTEKIVSAFVREYQESYPEIQKNEENLLQWTREEEAKFMKTLEKGLKELQKLGKPTGKNLFVLYSTYGFPLEMSFEELGISLGEQEHLIREFDGEAKKHGELSRTAAAGKFRGGLADHSEDVVRLHTATHLLNEALRRVVDSSIVQRGSNITSERLRFDFSFGRKLTDEEILGVEKLVNEKIAEGLPVRREEMSLREALRSGAQAEFGTKYPDTVSVYSIGDFSKELCGGPHVSNTSLIGKFKVLKQEASAAGVRRIKAVLEHGNSKH
ncbi:MAG: alanine--tRNA ligase [bacterium]|nr:alanine--tRNA ligase [bacterium]